MDARPHVIERAYQIARTGVCLTIAEIERHLKSEGYDGVDTHLADKELRRELLLLCRTARPRR